VFLIFGVQNPEFLIVGAFCTVFRVLDTSSTPGVQFFIMIVRAYAWANGLLRLILHGAALRGHGMGGLLAYFDSGGGSPATDGSTDNDGNYGRPITPGVRPQLQ